MTTNWNQYESPPAASGTDWEQYQSGSPSSATNWNQYSSTPQPSFLNTVKNIGIRAAALPLDVASGVASGTRDLAKEGAHLFSYGLPGAPAVQIPGLGKYLADKIPNGESITSLAGITPTQTDRDLMAMSSFIPTLVGGEAIAPEKIIQSLAAQAGKYGTEQAVSNESQGENPVTGLMLGAALPGGIDLAARGTSGTGKILGQWGVPAVLKKVFTSGDHNLTADTAFNKIKDNYANNVSNYNILSNNALNSAKNLDAQATKASVVNPFLKYNNQSYKNEVANIATVLKKEGLSTEGLDEVERWKDAPNSFVDAITKRKNLNKINIPFNNPSYQNLTNRLSSLRGTLIKNVEENAQRHMRSGNPAAADFLNNWKGANHYYSNNVAPFESTFTNKGMLRPNRELKGVWAQGSTPHSNLIKQFLSTSGKNPDLNTSHFHNLVGEPHTAAQALRESHFLPNYTSDGSPSTSFLTKYSKLSSQMKKNLFTPEQQDVLDNIQSVFHKSEGGKVHGLGSFFIPAEIGGRVAEAAGGRWTTGALAGLLGRNLGTKALGALVSGETGTGLTALPRLGATLSHLSAPITQASLAGSNL